MVLLLPLEVCSALEPLIVFDGSLLDARDGKVLLRDSFLDARDFIYPEEDTSYSTIWTVDLATLSDLTRISSDDVLTAWPQLNEHPWGARHIRYSFGGGGRIDKDRLIASAPGEIFWICDCAMEPPLEENGRPGGLFAFDSETGAPVLSIAARRWSRFKTHYHRTSIPHPATSTKSTGSTSATPSPFTGMWLWWGRGPTV